jgi:hypothetical protein
MVGGLIFVAILIGYFFRKFDLDRFIGLDVPTVARVPRRTTSVAVASAEVENVSKHTVPFENYVVITIFVPVYNNRTAPSTAPCAYFKFQIQKT